MRRLIQRRQVAPTGWIGLVVVLVLLWVMRGLAKSGAVPVLPAAGLLILLALIASMTIVWMAMRTRMTFPRLLAYVGLQAYTILIYALIYRSIGVIDSAGTVLRDTSSGLYFSLITWTTLGYGDLRPPENLRLLAGSQAILGYISMGILVALILHWLTSRSSPSE